MKIYVIGSTGMLGRYVSKYLGQHFSVVDIDRKIIDVSRVTEESMAGKFKEIGIQKDDIIINCAGTIKTRVDELGDLNAILVNSVFPRVLANVAQSHNIQVIHPTTDCVYSGLKGNYSENENMT